METEDQNSKQPDLHLMPAEEPQEPVDRQSIIHMALEYMLAGNTLNAAALRCGYSPATIWRWLHADEEGIIKYERAKIQRSRALIEHALYEMQLAQTLDEARTAERKANLYLRMAAKLNPKEFSDRMHSPVHKAALGAGPVSFVLNIGRSDAHASRELVVVEQPEDGELP